MEKQKFEAVLTLLVPQVIRLITEHYPYDEVTASREFYESEVYSSLEQEDTKAREQEIRNLILNISM